MSVRDKIAARDLIESFRAVPVEPGRSPAQATRSHADGQAPRDLGHATEGPRVVTKEGTAGRDRHSNHQRQQAWLDAKLADFQARSDALMANLPKLTDQERKEYDARTRNRPRKSDAQWDHEIELREGWDYERPSR